MSDYSRDPAKRMLARQRQRERAGLTCVTWEAHTLTVLGRGYTIIGCTRCSLRVDLHVTRRARLRWLLRRLGDTLRGEAQLWCVSAWAGALWCVPPAWRQARLDRRS